MSGGQLLLLLHAHLPYVRHPEQERSLEERWLFETITECYLPLLSRLEALVDAGVEYRITLSLSPPLVSMWQDSLLRERYCRHLGEMIELAEREMLRTRQDPQLSALARYYRDRFRQARDQYERNYGKDILGAWLRLADAGRVELITTGATHGFLPLLRHGPGAVRAQLRVAGDFFEGYAGRRATGVWLPECGYFPGLEDEMAAAGFRYFFVEAHGLLRAAPRPRHGTLAPLACANGVAAFGRDPDCSREVWSRERGFPGHPAYREFHRDIGYELDPAALGPLALPDSGRAPTGIKYHRVTDRSTQRKDLYDPVAAQCQARLHAAQFVSARKAAGVRAGLRHRPPIQVAPYDAELFGHWWWEGPDWLAEVLRLAASETGLDLVTAGDYLQRHPVLYRATPACSSWGEGGYSQFWSGAENAWIQPHLVQAAASMRDLASRYAGVPPQPLARALNQAARSLLLAQASDWPFIMQTRTTVDYAQERIRGYIARFRYLHQSLLQGRVDATRLGALEEMDRIFPNLDYRVFAGSD